MQRCDTPLGLLWRFILKCYSTSLHSYRMNETNNKCCFESNARFFSATDWLLPFVAKLRAVPTLLRAVLCQEQGTHSIRMFFYFFLSVLSSSHYGKCDFRHFYVCSQQNANSAIIYSYCTKQKIISYKEQKHFILFFSIQWKGLVTRYCQV